jgi:predicted short-subunit dehydrogenase-like oxidoreductase (DUF2520 family)
MIPAIYICGTGNVSNGLATIFAEKGIPVKGVFSRKENQENSTGLLDYSSHKVEKGVYVFLAVPDSHIEATANKVRGIEITFIHCSGSIPLSVLPGNNRGVFYPLQTFSGGSMPSWDQLPVLIESESKSIETTLSNLATSFGARPLLASSFHRGQIHLAAVFANNFTNAMMRIAQEIALKSGLPLDILQPLLTQTLHKLDNASAFDSQTGPARRHDTITIKKHLDMLSSNPEVQHLYGEITKFIETSYKG